MSNAAVVVAAAPAKRSYLLPFVLVAQLPIMLLVGYLSTRGFWLSSLWAIEGLSMLVFVMVLGESKGRIGGVLISSRNVMSLSRFQIVAWTLLICSAFITIALARVFHNHDDALAIKLPTELWQLLGISGASTVGAAMVMQRKSQKTPAPAEMTRAATALKESEEDMAAQTDGVAFRNKDPKDARFTDMFEGDEIVNAAYTDVGKVQMFFFTLVALVAYAAQLAQFMNDTAVRGLSMFPVLPSGLVAILGISHATYIANKNVDQTKTT